MHINNQITPTLKREYHRFTEKIFINYFKVTPGGFLIVKVED